MHILYTINMKIFRILICVFIIFLILGCCTYPSTNQLKRKEAKQNKELVSKLIPAPLPKKFTEQGNESIYLKTGWYIVTDSTQGIPREMNINSKKEVIYIDTLVQLKPKDIELFYLTTDSKDDKVVHLIMYFDKAGTEKWSILTKQFIDKKLAFVINNKIEMTPKVNSQITNGAFILWGYDYTPEEMFAIKNLLETQKNE